MENKLSGLKIRVAMLASGSGTNVENFIHYFNNHPLVEIALVVSNNPRAFVLERALKARIPSVVIPRTEWKDGQLPLEVVTEHNIDYIVLAGFLQLIPGNMIKAYPGRIINIHPALLPHYGGKGMYGMKVHEEVIAAKEIQSGISIHLVNERYDEGAILFQAKVEVTPDDTPESLAAKIHALEYENFPKVVEDHILSGNK